MFDCIEMITYVFCQQFQVVATETVNPVAREANVDCAIVTEKLDGTCCYVSVFEGNLLIFPKTLFLYLVILLPPLCLFVIIISHPNFTFFF